MSSAEQYNSCVRSNKEKRRATQSTQQQPFLSPVETLKEDCLEEFNDYNLNEFRLHRQPESLTAFSNIFFKKKGGTYDDNRIIWVKDDCFVCLRDVEKLPQVYRKQHFRLLLTRDWRYHSLSIHSSTLEEAISCLDFLVGLEDTYYEKMELFLGEDDYEDGEPRTCRPLTNLVLEKLLVQNKNRLNLFCGFIFTRAQCGVLAAGGRRTNIGFYSCEFEDGGVAFVEASVAREDDELGPATLRIYHNLPFDKGNFALFVVHHKLRCLELSYIRLNSEEACRALAEADLQYLELESCCLADRGAAFVESVRDGRGSKGFHFMRYDDDDEEAEDDNEDNDNEDDEWVPFDSQEWYMSFMDALGANSYVERLDLSCFRFHHGTPQALVTALRENEGLAHLGLVGRLHDLCWGDLAAAISTHPSLRTLAFEHIDHEYGLPNPSVKRDTTKAVADMLLVNNRVDEITIPFFGNHIFDPALWQSYVGPRLECNRYRKLFVPLQEIELASTRAAVVARALARVARKPSLVWMILSQNRDVLCDYQGGALSREDSVPTTSRKRKRSSSGDDI
jgi:hypothetical protein